MAIFGDNVVLNDYERPRKVRFNPYDDNGGSTVALSGDDFAVIGADTRLSTGYSILTRQQTKLFQLTGSAVLGVSGCWADALQLLKHVKSYLLNYQHNHNKEMSVTAIAQMLSCALYYKRFFPYSLSNVLAGIDSDGKGCVFSYDPIGNFERYDARAGGSSTALLQPLLDNQVKYANMESSPQEKLTVEKAVALIKDVFISATERDIYTGDSLHLIVLTKDGSKSEKFELRKD